MLMCANAYSPLLLKVERLLRVQGLAMGLLKALGVNGICHRDERQITDLMMCRWVQMGSQQQTACWKACTRCCSTTSLCR